MHIYRNLSVMPRFLKRPDKLFHTSAIRMIRFPPVLQSIDSTKFNNNCRLEIHQMMTKLNANERDALRKALDNYDSNNAVRTNEVPAVSRQDLLKLMAVNSIPFVGFGFLDNFLMIIAGDYIENSLGTYMCLSTMAAAALGNTISDVMGLGLAHYVEAMCLFLGMRPPSLTKEQIDSKACRRVMSYGRAIGITIGCILGMMPLYFMNKKPKKQSENAT